MAGSNVDKVFDAEAIRDTALKTSTQADSQAFVLKTIIIENGLNQDVTLQLCASANSDFSNSFNVGSSFVVTANTDSYETTDSYFPYLKITAQCSTAPTTGSLTVFLFKES
jgi:hypothetical protein